MERDFLEKQGLNAEQVKAVMAQAGKETNALRDDYDRKLASLNDQVDGYKSQISDRDKQIKTLGSQAKDNEELKAKVAEFEKANKEKEKEWSSKLASQKKEFAISTALSKAGALENKAVLPFIDTNKVSLDENGNLIGFQEQVDAAKQDYGFLFKQDKPKEEQKPATHVVVSGNGTSEVPKDPANMSLDQQTEMFKKDPQGWANLFRKK
ncbi:scaffolding protein [Lactobacillus paragasseri]|uniref:Phage scaffolding protein n=1 Tax=Lactobacillus paragasseri TaxID=2107999 RepID=A0AAW6XR33_9LACO|nr:phage scaffolding protein [Lactobacillus paragasseri]MDK6868401.1 phage scaffolding protein [Lactobacillus paragasseri]TVV00030.1 scaffolding protein [Lactobacillus paragasseri]